MPLDIETSNALSKVKVKRKVKVESERDNRLSLYVETSESGNTSAR